LQSGETHVELKVLHDHGWSVSALAREFGLSRNTVYRELTSPGPRRYAERERPATLNEAQQMHVERRLAVCPSIRGTDLHLELRLEYGYESSYPAFQRLLRPLRPAVVRDPEIRFETGPGLQTQADWAHLGLWPLGSEMVGCRPWSPSWAAVGRRRSGSRPTRPGRPRWRAWPGAWTTWAG
jgi:transposase